MKKSAVFIFPRGEAIRNFGYGECFSRLNSELDCKILSVKPNDRIWALLKNQSLRLEELVELQEAYPVRLLRELLDMAHGRWLWSEAAKERWRLRDMECRTALQKVKRFGKKCLVTPLATRRGVNVLSSVERGASKAFQASAKYIQLYKEWRPTIVFNASHVHSRNSIQAVYAAQWLGIPTATFIFSWDNLTSQGRVLPLYDYFLVWNEQLKTQLLEIYDCVKPHQVFVTGTPQFDHHFKPDQQWSRDKFCRSVGADPDKRIVLYATGMPNHMPDEQLLVEDLADILKGEFSDIPTQLLVRVYAKDRSGRFEELKARRHDILFQNVLWEPHWLTPLTEDLPLWTNTLLHCDVGINVASTVSLELCMFDKPVINIGYNPATVPESEMRYLSYYKFDHYAPIIESGGVRLARNREEMVKELNRALRYPRDDSTERKALIEKMFLHTLDGQSGVRCAEALIEIARRESRNPYTKRSSAI